MTTTTRQPPGGGRKDSETEVAEAPVLTLVGREETQDKENRNLNRRAIE